jgi:hypothetical protein
MSVGGSRRERKEEKKRERERRSSSYAVPVKNEIKNKDAARRS